ncbi:MAG: ketopantoate reductase family protein [Spirochaetes bacterium]|jgi:2-dehydropantoate 2-reductase|nr:ketopantoate reductase family protein [Spirochaetota bacterium]
MKAGIVGGGAVGTLFAAFFHSAGIDYAVYEKDETLARAMSEGLCVHMPDGELCFSSETATAPNILSPCDVVFLFVKSYSTDDAMRDIASSLKNGSVLVTLQNGIGNRDIIGRYLPPDRIVCGSITIGATRIDASTVAYGGSGGAVIGGPDALALESVRALLERAGVMVTIHPRPDEAIWHKAVINAAINPIGALLEIPNGGILERPDALILQEHVIKECVLVAASRGIIFDATELVDTTRGVCAKTSANLCSMLQDLRAGRRTEIDSINGAFARFGREAGIAAPYNESLYRLVRARERPVAG